MYNEVQYSANVEMERLLNEAAGNVRALLQRNRAALDAIIAGLTRGGEGALTGEVRFCFPDSCATWYACSVLAKAFWQCYCKAS